MDDSIRIGIPLHVDASKAADVAEAAEAVGCESVWVSEHLIWPETLPDTYPYTEGNLPPVTSETETHDPWVVLAAAAARTTEIRLGTRVYILPLRNPFVTAQAVGTLDSVSSGRVVLGAGIGWLQEEFEVVGQAWRDRAKRSEEILEILRRLWSGDVVDFCGDYYDFPAVRFAPPPPQGSKLPIHLGGESEIALDRAARLGDGWIGMRHDPEDAAQFVRRIRKRRAHHGLDPEAFEVTVAAPSTLDAPMAERYAQSGVDRLIVKPWRGVGDLSTVRAGLDRIGELVSELG